MKIAVIQPKMIGDVLITSVIFEELKQKFPTAELHFIVNKNTIPVLENNPFIDKVIILEPNIEKGFSGFFMQMNRIRNEKYDIIIDSYSKLKTAIFCKFSGAKRTISFHKSYSKFFYTETIVRTKHSISTATKAVEHRLQLLKPLGIDFQVIKPKLYLQNSEIEIKPIQDMPASEFANKYNETDHIKFVSNLAKEKKWTNFYRDTTDYLGNNLGKHEVKNLKLKVELVQLHLD